MVFGYFFFIYISGDIQVFLMCLIYTNPFIMLNKIIANMCGYMLTVMHSMLSWKVTKPQSGWSFSKAKFSGSTEWLFAKFASLRLAPHRGGKCSRHGSADLSGKATDHVGLWEGQLHAFAKCCTNFSNCYVSFHLCYARTNYPGTLHSIAAVQP